MTPSTRRALAHTVSAARPTLVSGVDSNNKPRPSWPARTSAWVPLCRFVDELQGLVGWPEEATDHAEDGDDADDAGAPATTSVGTDTLDQSIYFDPESADEEEGGAEGGTHCGVGAGSEATVSSALADIERLHERLMEGPASRIDGRVMPEWRVLLGRPTVTLHTLMVCLSLEELLATGTTATPPTAARPLWPAAAMATPRELNIVRWAALLHDIAKMRCGGDAAHPFRCGGVAVSALCRVVRVGPETRVEARAWAIRAINASTLAVRRMNVTDGPAVTVLCMPRARSGSHHSHRFSVCVCACVCAHARPR